MCNSDTGGQLDTLVNRYVVRPKPRRKLQDGGGLDDGAKETQQGGERGTVCVHCNGGDIERERGNCEQGGPEDGGCDGGEGRVVGKHEQLGS